MKKILFILSVLFLLCFSTTYAAPNGVFKFKFGCAGCTGCPNPLGICFYVPIDRLVSDGYTLPSADTVESSGDTSGGWGIAKVEIVSGQVHMIFQHAAALPDGTIPVPNNWDLGSLLSSALGYTDVTVTAGTYVVNFSNYPTYGEIYMNCTLTP